MIAKVTPPALQMFNTLVVGHVSGKTSVEKTWAFKTSTMGLINNGLADGSVFVGLRKDGSILFANIDDPLNDGVIVEPIKLMGELKFRIKFHPNISSQDKKLFYKPRIKAALLAAGMSAEAFEKMYAEAGPGGYSKPHGIPIDVLQQKYEELGAETKYREGKRQRTIGAEYIDEAKVKPAPAATTTTTSASAEDIPPASTTHESNGKFIVITDPGKFAYDQLTKLPGLLSQANIAYVLHATLDTARADSFARSISAQAARNPNPIKGDVTVSHPPAGDKTTVTTMPSALTQGDLVAVTNNAASMQVAAEYGLAVTCDTREEAERVQAVFGSAYKRLAERGPDGQAGDIATGRQ